MRARFTDSRAMFAHIRARFIHRLIFISHISQVCICGWWGREVQGVPGISATFGKRICLLQSPLLGLLLLRCHGLPLLAHNCLLYLDMNLLDCSCYIIGTELAEQKSSKKIAACKHLCLFLYHTWLWSIVFPVKDDNMSIQQILYNFQ